MVIIMRLLIVMLHVSVHKSAVIKPIKASVTGYNGYTIQLEWSVNLHESEQGELAFEYNDTYISDDLKVINGIVQMIEYQASDKYRFFTSSTGIYGVEIRRLSQTDAGVYYCQILNDDKNSRIAHNYIINASARINLDIVDYESLTDTDMVVIGLSLATAGLGLLVSVIVFLLIKRRRKRRMLFGKGSLRQANKPSRDTMYGEIREVDLTPEDQLNTVPEPPPRDATYNHPFEDMRVHSLQRCGESPKKNMAQFNKYATMPDKTSIVSLPNTAASPRDVRPVCLIKDKMAAFEMESERSRSATVAKEIDDEYLTTATVNEMREETREPSTAQSSSKMYANSKVLELRDDTSRRAECFASRSKSNSSEYIQIADELSATAHPCHLTNSKREVFSSLLSRIRCSTARNEPRHYANASHPDPDQTDKYANIAQQEITEIGNGFVQKRRAVFDAGE